MNNTDPTFVYVNTDPCISCIALSFGEQGEQEIDNIDCDGHFKEKAKYGRDFLRFITKYLWNVVKFIKINAQLKVRHLYFG